MVLDVKPIANIVALAVDRQALTGESVQDRQRDQLLWKMVGSVIVRAVGDDDRQAVGSLPCLRQMVRRRLRGRVRGARIVRRFFGEQAFFAEGTVDLVGRDMEEAKRLFLGAFKVRPIAPGGL